MNLHRSLLGLGTVLTPDQIFSYATGAGFDPSTATTMTAIALRESGGDPNALNSTPPDLSYGLWQINMYGSLGPARLQQFGLTSNSQLLDPQTNANAAFQVSGGGTNLNPWTTYTRGSLNQFMPQAVQAAADAGYDSSNNSTSISDGTFFTNPDGSINWTSVAILGVGVAVVAMLV